MGVEKGREMEGKKWGERDGGREVGEGEKLYTFKKNVKIAFAASKKKMNKFSSQSI